LGNIIAAMLNGNFELRPSADDVGRFPSVREWKADIGFRTGNLTKMVRTIKGRNFMLLGDKLPKRRYEGEGARGGRRVWNSNPGSEMFGDEQDYKHRKSGGLKSAQIIDTPEQG
jgi:hypothetical protein